MRLLLCLLQAAVAAAGMFAQGPACPNRALKAVDPAALDLGDALFGMDMAVTQAFAGLGVAGAEVAVAYRGEVIYDRSFGTTDLSEPDASASLDTLYRIGSISKVFTALLAVNMRDAGLWSLDDKVVQYQPDFALLDSPGSREITLRSLMGQVSGLPREVPAACDFGGECYNVSTAEVVERLQGIGMNFEPLEQASYSNLGFALLGQLAAQVAGLGSYDAALDKYVLQPMRLGASGDGDRSADPLAAVGYTAGVEQPWVDIGWCAPAGNLYSSARDLLRLAQALMGSGQGLSAVSARELLSTSFAFNDAFTSFDFPFEAAEVANGLIAHTKGGNINGFGTSFGVVPELQLSFAVLINSDASGDDLSWPLLQSLVPGLQAALTAAQPPLRLAPFADSLTGSWTSDDGSMTLEIVLQNGRLYSSLDGNVGLLEWAGSSSSSAEGLFYLRSILSNPAQSCFMVSLGAAEGLGVNFDLEASPKSMQLPGLYYGLSFYQGASGPAAAPAPGSVPVQRLRLF